MTNIDYSGFSLGTVEAGQTSEYVFTIDLDEDWVADNCHVVVFVTVPDEKGRYYSVTNAVDVPLEGIWKEPILSNMLLPPSKGCSRPAGVN